MATESKLTRRREMSKTSDTVSFVRRVYKLKGIPSGSSEEEILEHGRNPDSFSGDDQNKVPAKDAPLYGLSTPQFQARMSQRFPGEAMVTVTWGYRFIAGGPAIGTNELRGSGGIDRIVQPYMVPVVTPVVGGDPVVFNEVRERLVKRAVSVIELTRLLPSGLDTDAAQTIYLANLNKLYDRGLLTNVQIRERPGTNSLISTQFTYYGALPEQEAGAVESGSLAIEALPAMGEYADPTPGSGTTIVEPLDLYEEGAALPWL